MYKTAKGPVNMEMAVDSVLNNINAINSVISDIDIQLEQLTNPEEPVTGSWVKPYATYLRQFRGLAEQLRNHAFTGIDLFAQPEK